MVTSTLTVQVSPDQLALKFDHSKVVYTTGKDGTVVVTGLIPGATYVVTETRVPSGYVLNSAPQTITVRNGTGNIVTSGGTSGSGSGNGSGGNDLVFENDPKGKY